MSLDSHVPKCGRAAQKGPGLLTCMPGALTERTTGHLSLLMLSSFSKELSRSIEDLFVVVQGSPLRSLRAAGAFKD